MRCLVVHCHPDPESYSAHLFSVVRRSLQAAGHEVRCIDLYAEGFNPVLSLAEKRVYLTDPQALAQQLDAHVQALKGCEHLIFVFPIWFYGPPAMLKGWLERVWLPGVAFLPPPTKGAAAQPGLQHIQALSVVTHGGAPAWWLWLIGNPAKRLFTRGLRALMAKRCRTQWLQLHNMNNATAAEREAFSKRVGKAFEH
jgi:NAD(P)H dehydrogenase (quinone)